MALASRITSVALKCAWGIRSVLSQSARSWQIFHSSTLSGFEPGDGIRMVPRACNDPNLLILRSTMNWPTVSEKKAAQFKTHIMCSIQSSMYHD